MKTALLAIFALAIFSSAKAQKIDTVKNNISDTTIVDNPTVEAEFPGGKEKFNKFLAKTVRYPAKAKEYNTQGKVIVKVVIEKDGSITNPKVIQAVSPELDKETLRVISVSPKFIPGLVNGKPVRSYYDFPLSFTLVTAQ